MFCVCVRFWHDSNSIDFPQRQTGAPTLAPGEAYRRKAEVCSSANYKNCATAIALLTEKFLNLNAIAESAVGVATFTCHGMSVLQHTLTNT